MLAMFSHPCIMVLYGISEDDDGLLMVLEYCGGGDLSHYYQTSKFTKLEFCRICLELFSAVAYMHSLGIGHHDIKPENILLDLDGFRVKLADFGLSKSSSDVITKGVGTPAYMVVLA